MAKAMKVMKAMKAAAMKAMKKKRVSKIAKGSLAKSVVLRGTKEKTASGLTAKDLMMNKRGKVVSKKASAAAKKKFMASGLGKWSKAVQKARAILKLKGFVAIKKGSPLYTKAKEIYSQ
jgi:primosomal replication protein N